jgi:hypothetical protein
VLTGARVGRGWYRLDRDRHRCDHHQRLGHSYRLREIPSHHLVAYHEDTGRDVVKGIDARTRQIELRAKLGKPALDQARLPLGLSRHLGQHVEIPAAPAPQHLEVTPEPAS